MLTNRSTRLVGRGRLSDARGKQIVLLGLLGLGAALLAIRYSGVTPASAADTERAGAAIAGVRQGDQCLTPDAAIEDMAKALVGAGLSDWQVTARSDTRQAACVTSSVDGATKSVILIPALRPAVRTRMQQVMEALYDACLGRDAAVGYVTKALREVGETAYEIRTEGPITAPIEREKEVFKHVDDGCWIYSGTGWTEDGLRLYYVVGK